MNYIFPSVLLFVVVMTSKGNDQITWDNSCEERPYNMTIKNQVVIVTGGTRGLGKNFVEHLLREHAKVAFGGTNTKLGEQLEKEYAEKFGKSNVLFTRLDVTDQKSFENIFNLAKAKWGGVDILINNAGVGYEDKDNWEKTIDVNYKGSVRGQMLAIEHMGKHKGGKGGTVVMISSRVALITGYQWPHYSSSKKAQLGFVQAMGYEFYEKHFNIRTMALCPSLTDTELPTLQGQNTFIPELIPILGNRTLHAIRQRPESVSKGLVQILRNGTSGSTWLVEDDEPPRQIRFWNDF